MAKTILVIDDADAVRMTIGFTLQEEGFETIEAADGQDALNKLNGREIDLIICDVNMPIMDGITFLKKIKTDAKYAAYKFTPLIMVTTEAGEKMKDEGKQLGAKVWIVKPFKPEQLIKSINMLIA